MINFLIIVNGCLIALIAYLVIEHQKLKDKVKDLEHSDMLRKISNELKESEDNIRNMPIDEIIQRMVRRRQDH